MTSPTHSDDATLKERTTDPKVPPHRCIWLFSYATVWVYSFKIEPIPQRGS